jgi:hypothetical protein
MAKVKVKYNPCPKCGHKTVLASAIVSDFFPDDEPYSDGMEERTEQESINTEVNVGIHYCEKCDELVDAWIEEPYDNGYGRICQALERAKKKIKKLEADLRDR